MLPVETATRQKREVLQMCQDLVRHSSDSMRSLHRMITSYDPKKLDEMRPIFEEIKVAKERALVLKRNLSNELIAAGAILLSREDFLRLAVPITEISDLAEGVAYRLMDLIERKGQIANNLLTKIAELSEGVLDCVLKLREVVFALNFNTERVESLAVEVEAQERKVDECYRAVVLSIAYSNSLFSTILVLKDIADMLEEISDKAEDATDSARILALSAL
jgi:uncharacterized protein Yka (UPF0111/DUF47 family)